MNISSLLQNRHKGTHSTFPIHQPVALFERLRRKIDSLDKENRDLRKRVAEDAKKIAELERKADVLKKELEDRDKKINDREKKIDELDKKVDDLEHQLAGFKKDSSNSSKPPSSDGPAAKKRIHPQRKKSRCKPGGQPGHFGHSRPLVPTELVNRVIVMLPDSCKRCHRKFTKEEKQAALAGDVYRHQVMELPEIKPDITECQFPSITCCGVSNRVPIPAEICSGVGPRLVAVISYLTLCRIPRRKVEQMLEIVMGTRISLGSTQKYLEETSRALEGPYKELQEQLRHERVVNGDETGWRKNAEKRWLWVFVARFFAFFVIAKNRSSKVLEQVLGPAFAGILGSDRFSAYIKYHKGILQFCWAHLKRDLLGIEQLDKTTDSDHFARDALALHARLFRLWHRYRGGSIDRSQLIDRAIPIEKKFFALGERYLDSKDDAIYSLADLFFMHTEKLFAFVYHEGVEPTNNISERTIRQAVQWRKISFGNRSDAGEIVTARLLTAGATCSIQKRNLLDYLTDAIRCHRQGLVVPSLLPQAQ
jgi:transposase